MEKYPCHCKFWLYLAICLLTLLFTRVSRAEWADWGECQWEIIEDGSSNFVLRLQAKPGSTSCTLPEVTNHMDAPWYQKRLKIIGFRVEENTRAVYLGKQAVGLFFNMGKCVDWSGLLKVKPTDDTTSLAFMFQNARISDLRPFRDWNLSNVVDMSYMFAGCTSITLLGPLRGWDEWNVMNMGYLFAGCTGLTDLSPLRDWKMSSVTDMSSMFEGCSGLTDLSPLAGWNVSRVMDMGSMFKSCTGLTDLSPLGAWDVSAVADMSSMFSGCTDLTYVSGLRWNAASAENCMLMFYGCTSLVYLDLSSWTSTRYIKNLIGFLAGDDALEKINLSGWSLSTAHSEIVNHSPVFMNDLLLLTGEEEGDIHLLYGTVRHLTGTSYFFAGVHDADIEMDEYYWDMDGDKLCVVRKCGYTDFRYTDLTEENPDNFGKLIYETRQLEPPEYPPDARPEDEIGTYYINENGQKEYAQFHSYDICMNYMGDDNLCRNTSANLYNN